VTHLVKEGDTLWDIAGFYYQNPFLWPIIWNANLDKVTDPHWIYPEQVLIIPPAPESTLAGDTVPIVPAETMVVAIQETLPPETTYYAPTPTKDEIEVSFVAPERKVFTEELVHRVGYLTTEDIIGAGTILKSEPERPRITNFMKVYTDLVAPDTKVDDVYTIYKIGDAVSDPENGNDLGKVVTVYGKLKIQEMAEGGSKGQVTVSHDIIEPGTPLMPYPKYEIPTNVTLKQTERLLEGQIAYVRSKDPLTMNYTICYINRGTNDNVAIGDLFRVYEVREYGGRKLPDLVVGELAVVIAKPTSSSCVLTWRRLTHKVSAGDKIRLYMEAH
jgi:hypothetical protein